MQRLHGKTLFKFEEKGLPLSQKQKDMICLKIKKMHSLAVLHNDLHKNNIFIDSREPFIIDFGLSQIIHPSKADEYKAKGNFLSFLSTEQAEQLYDQTLKSSYLMVDDLKPGEQYCIKAGWPCERANKGNASTLLMDCEVHWKEGITAGRSNSLREEIKQDASSGLTPKRLAREAEGKVNKSRFLKHKGTVAGPKRTRRKKKKAVKKFDFK